MISHFGTETPATETTTPTRRLLLEIVTVKDGKAEAVGRFPPHKNRGWGVLLHVFCGKTSSISSELGTFSDFGGNFRAGFVYIDITSWAKNHPPFAIYLNSQFFTVFSHRQTVWNSTRRHCLLDSHRCILKCLLGLQEIVGFSGTTYLLCQSTMVSIRNCPTSTFCSTFCQFVFCQSIQLNQHPISERYASFCRSLGCVNSEIPIDFLALPTPFTEPPPNQGCPRQTTSMKHACLAWGNPKPKPSFNNRHPGAGFRG